MAIAARSSDEQVVKENKLFTGLCNMKVVAFNPTREVLESMGYSPQNDPVYVSVDEVTNDEKVRLDVYLQGDSPTGEVIRTKIAFFLQNRQRTNKEETKGEWINDYGRSAWGSIEAPPNTYKRFDHETARPCKIGESDLHSFLINWLNVNPKDEAKLDKFNNLFKGDYSELNTLLKLNKENKIRVLLTVKEGKYQSVYNKYFDRASNKRVNYWQSHLEKQAEGGYGISDDFSSSLKFQEWKEPEMSLDKESEEKSSSDFDTNDPF